MKKLLWVGDAGVPSGFAKATHGILDTLQHHYDVTALAMNFRGGPVPYSYPLYPAAAGGDAFGVGRLIEMCDRLETPDVIVIQQDGWNFQNYIAQLQRFEEYKNVPVVAIVAVDGKNFQAAWLNGVSLAIFWTEFGLNEARKAGYAGPAAVIPLGVDLGTFYPTDKYEARKAKQLPDVLDDVFIVGNVNRNQPRKRLDLMVKYFAEWVNTRGVNDAYLYLHVAPTGDAGIAVADLAKYYGVFNRLALAQPSVAKGDTEDQLRDTYNSFNVQVNPGQGEGFGLTTLEGMACGVHQIVSDWSALGEWASGAADLIPCSDTAIGPPYVNVIGGVLDGRLFVEALHSAYLNWRETGHSVDQVSLDRAASSKFRWENIGQGYMRVLKEVLP